MNPSPKDSGFFAFIGSVNIKGDVLDLYSRQVGSIPTQSSEEKFFDILAYNVS
jgi:hypothetical protein